MSRELERLTREATIKRINDLSERGDPFVFLISYSGEKNLVLPSREAVSNDMHLEMPGCSNQTLSNIPTLPIEFKLIPVDAQEYLDAFSQVMSEIHYGNSFLLNLTFPTTVETNYSLKEIFAASKARFKLCLKDEFVVFSPERFIKIRGRTISSNPMKGTINAAVPGAHSALASNRKEDAEHNTIVDLIRNDLSIVASNVRVKRFKYIEKLRTNRGELLQMSSEITGKLPIGFRSELGDILFRLLPAGSICGAPKKKTLQIINEVESYERGYYTGIFGHFDGSNLDSAVAIRCLERSGDKIIFKSGGGITFQSKWEQEYEEMKNKVYVPIY